MDGGRLSTLICHVTAWIGQLSRSGSDFDTVVLHHIAGTAWGAFRVTTGPSIVDVMLMRCLSLSTVGMAWKHGGQPKDGYFFVHKTQEDLRSLVLINLLASQSLLLLPYDACTLSRRFCRSSDASITRCQRLYERRDLVTTSEHETLLRPCLKSMLPISRSMTAVAAPSTRPTATVSSKARATKASVVSTSSSSDHSPRSVFAPPHHGRFEYLSVLSSPPLASCSPLTTPHAASPEATDPAIDHSFLEIDIACCRSAPAQSILSLSALHHDHWTSSLSTEVSGVDLFLYDSYKSLRKHYCPSDGDRACVGCSSDDLPTNSATK